MKFFQLSVEGASRPVPTEARLFGRHPLWEEESGSLAGAPPIQRPQLLLIFGYFLADFLFLKFFGSWG